MNVRDGPGQGAPVQEGARHRDNLLWLAIALVLLVAALAGVLALVRG